MATKLPYLSDDHHFAIANVAAQAAQLDVILDSIVYLTIQPSQVSLYLVKSLGPDRLVEILKLALVAELTEYESQLNELFEQVKTMRGERNRILHWLCESTDVPEVARFVEKRRGRQRIVRNFKATDIQNIADAIGACCGEIQEWWNLYNWHHEVRLHGKPEQLAHPPRWALPKKLRPPDTPPPPARPPHKRQG